MKTNRPDMTSFEKDMQQVFSGKEFMPDTEAMWANIAPHIRKRNKAFTWQNILKGLLSFGLVMVVFFSAINYFRSGLTMVAPPSELTSIPMGQESRHNVSVFGYEDDEKDQLDEINNEIQIDESIKAEVLQNKEDQLSEKSKVISDNSDINTSKLISSESTITKNKSNTSGQSNEHFIQSAASNTNTSENLIQNEKTIIVQSYIEPIVKTTYSNAGKTVSQNLNKGSSTIIHSSEKYAKSSFIRRGDNLIYENIALQSYSAINGSSTILDDLFKEVTVDEYKRKWKKVRRKHGCYDFSLRRWRNELDVYIGPDWTKKYLEPKTALYEKNAEARLKSEQKLEAFSIGIQYNLRHRSGFYGSIGLNYSQIDEKFELKTLSSDTSIRNGVIRIDIDSSGKKTETMGDVENHDIITWDKGTYNYYRFLSIPVTLGYGFSFYGFGVEPSVGVDFNFLFLKKGEILSAQSATIKFDNITSNHPKKAEVFKSSVGFSGIAALKIIYPYSARMDFFGETYVRYQLKPITIDDYPLEQKYRTIGLRLGARFKF